MAIAVLLLVVAIALLGAWLARLDFLLHGLLERERASLEDEAERLRRRGM